MKTPRIIKLPSGKYHAQVQIDGKRLSVTADSRKDVEREVLNLKLKNTNTGKYNAAVTLKEGIECYIDTKKDILSPSTIRGYEVIKRNRFKSVMNKKLSSVHNWQQIVNDESRTCSAKTLKNAWGLVRSVLSVNGIQAEKILLPKVIEKERTWIQPEQIPAFLEAVRGSKFEIAYLACLHGLRASEMLALNKEDITTEITVNKAYVQGSDHKMVLKHMTKNEASTRKVPVFVTRLTELAFSCPSGRLIRSKSCTLNKHLETICKTHNLPVVTLHELRHTYVSLMYHLQISEKQAMQFGGYSDLATMRKIYTHLAIADRNKAVDVMKSFIENANKMQTDNLKVS